MRRAKPEPQLELLAISAREPDVARRGIARMHCCRKLVGNYHSTVQCPSNMNIDESFSSVLRLCLASKWNDRLRFIFINLFMLNSIFPYKKKQKNPICTDCRTTFALNWKFTTLFQCATWCYYSVYSCLPSGFPWAAQRHHCGHQCMLFIEASRKAKAERFLSFPILVITGPCH